MKDIVSAIRAAKEAPTTENLEQMWRRVFRLPAWYLLPSGLEGPVTPLVARQDDGDWVLAFTHLRALNAFGRSANMRSESGEIPMLALPPTEAAEHLDAVAEHVTGISFNVGSELAFRAPLAAIREFREQFGMSV